MIREKEESCPRCGGTLDQGEYDMQFHVDCGWYHGAREKMDGLEPMHPFTIRMLRNFPEDQRTPEHLRPNKLMGMAADEIDRLRAALSRAEQAQP